MSYIERGLYRELLDECWAEGFIPDDIEKLADICGCSAEVMANAWQVLSKCFANASNGFLINERLEQERTEIDKTRVNRARAGAAGGKAKSSNGAGSDSTSQANASKCQANASWSHIEEKSLEEFSKDIPPNPQGGNDACRRRTKVDDTPYNEIRESFCTHLPMLPQPKPVDEWPDGRKSAVKSRHNEHKHRPDFWNRYFGYVAKSKFLTGQTEQRFEATIDWLLKPANMQKIREGNYEDKAVDHG